MAERTRRRSQGGLGGHVVSGSGFNSFGRSKTADEWLLDAVDVGFAGVVCLVPLVLGGRFALGQFLLIVLTVWTAAAWAFYQWKRRNSEFVRSGAEPLLIAAVALVGLQLAPLPSDWLGLFSPQTADALPLWSSESAAEAGFAPWLQLSLTPAETRNALVVLLAYCLLFVVAVQRIRRLEDVERLLKCIALAAVGMAAAGLLQYFVGNGKYLWIFQYPLGSSQAWVTGSFTNRNHFADFLALGIGPMLWWTLQAFRRDAEARRPGRHDFAKTAQLPLQGRHWLLAAGLALVAFATIMSLSRGGNIAALVAAAVCLFAHYRAKLLNGQIVAGLLAIGSTILLGLLVYGEDLVQDRMAETLTTDLNVIDAEIGRREIWHAATLGIADYPLLGTGAGSHRAVNPMYLDVRFDGQEFTHAESGYLQVALENGLVGLGLLLIGIVWCFSWCWRGMRAAATQPELGCLAAVTAGLTASVVHSGVDFVWYVPGCMVVVILLAAAACRLWQLARQAQNRPVRSWPVPRAGWLAAAVSVLALCGWMLQTNLPRLQAEPHWTRYLIATFEGTPAVVPDDDDDMPTFRERMTELTLTANANPEDARAHLRAASGYLTLFHIMQNKTDNPMTLAQIREAAWASEFETTEAMNRWVDQVIEDNRKYLSAARRHARAAVSLSPLEGHGYLYLSSLCFLDGAGPEIQQAYIDQAQRVRPYDAQVHFVIGQEAWSAGDIERAVEHWRFAFHRSHVFRNRIIEMLADYVPAEFFLEQFEPDWLQLWYIARHYKRAGRTDDFLLVHSKYAWASVERARQAEKNDAAVIAWIQAYRAYQELNEPEAGYKCIQAAHRIDPNAYNVRFALGEWYYQQERFNEAAEHLVWCSRRKPEDTRLQRMTERATKERLRGPAQVAEEPSTPL